MRHLPAWFPGMEFKRDALSRMDQMAYVLNAPYNFTMGEIVRIAWPSSNALADMHAPLPAQGNRSTIDNYGYSEVILR